MRCSARVWRLPGTRLVGARIAKNQKPRNPRAGRRQIAATVATASPATTTIEEGALVEPLAVALHGVALSGLVPGAKILVIGAGPIGLAVAFWARRYGAAKVVVTDLNTFQAEIAQRIGVTAFLKAEHDVVAAVDAALGGAPDIVFECAGKPGVLAQALEHVRPRGTIVMLGLCTSQDSFVPFRAISKEVRFITSAFFKMSEYQAALDVLDGGNSAATALVTDTVSLLNMPAVFTTGTSAGASCAAASRVVSAESVSALSDAGGPPQPAVTRRVVRRTCAPDLAETLDVELMSPWTRRRGRRLSRVSCADAT